MKTIISQLPNRRNYMRGRFTVEIGYPWITLGAIMEVERQANIEHNVLELGSGGSTIFFSRRCKSVKSYETVPKWAEKVRSALPQNSNATLIFGNEEELLNAVKKEPDNYYDWLIADQGNSYEFRLRMMNESVSKLKSGGFMIVDNYDFMKFDYTGWKIHTYDYIGYHGKGTRICIKP